MRSKSSSDFGTHISGNVSSFLRAANNAGLEAASESLETTDPLMQTLRAVSDAGVAMPDIVKVARLPLQTVTMALRELEGSRLVRRVETGDRILFTVTPDGAALRDAPPSV